METLQTVNWDYPVALRNLKTVDEVGNIISSRFATVDESNGDIIGLVGNRYKLFQNKTIYDTLQQVASEMKMKLEKIYVSKGKRSTIFRYTFGENLEREVTNPLEKNDRIQFGFEVINSFDMGLPVSQFRAYANRLVCLNGLTIPKTIGRFSFRDLNNFREDRVKEELGNRITPIVGVVDTWNEWAKFTPDRIKVSDLINKRLPKKAAEKILQNYDEAKDKTMWGLYNICTYYTTHEVKTKNLENLRLRQYEVEALCNDFYDADLK